MGGKSRQSCECGVVRWPSTALGVSTVAVPAGQTTPAPPLRKRWRATALQKRKRRTHSSLSASSAVLTFRIAHFREDFLNREWPRMNANSRGEETAALPIRVDWRPFAVSSSFRLFCLFRGFTLWLRLCRAGPLRFHLPWVFLTVSFRLGVTHPMSGSLINARPESVVPIGSSEIPGQPNSEPHAASPPFSS